MKIDNSLTAIANVYKQLNADNPLLAATPANIELGVPAVRAAAPGENNTDITLTGIVGQGFKNTVTVSYTRLELDESVSVPATELFIQSGDDLADVKALIAAAWELVESDIVVAGTVPVSAGQSTTVTVTAIANSLVYIDSAPALTITISIDGIDLEAAVVVKQLTGFTKAA